MSGRGATPATRVQGGRDTGKVFTGTGTGSAHHPPNSIPALTFTHPHTQVHVYPGTTRLDKSDSTVRFKTPALHRRGESRDTYSNLTAVSQPSRLVPVQKCCTEAKEVRHRNGRKPQGNIPKRQCADCGVLPYPRGPVGRHNRENEYYGGTARKPSWKNAGSDAGDDTGTTAEPVPVRGVATGDLRMRTSVGAASRSGARRGP